MTSRPPKSPSTPVSPDTLCSVLCTPTTLPEPLPVWSIWESNRSSLRQVCVQLWHSVCCAGSAKSALNLTLQPRRSAGSSDLPMNILPITSLSRAKAAATADSPDTADVSVFMRSSLLPKRPVLPVLLWICPVPWRFLKYIRFVPQAS